MHCIPKVKRFGMCFDVLMVVFLVPGCQLTQSDYALEILHKAKPISSVSSGAGVVNMTSDSDNKFTSAAIPSARNMVSIVHQYSLCIIYIP
jgi:hypothetical protein